MDPILRELLDQLRDVLPGAKYIHTLEIYNEIRKMAEAGKMDDGFIAELCTFDRFYLLTEVLRTPYARHPWVYDRCREVEAETDDCLDLWARGHFKSTVITFAGGFQEIIKDREITIAIFSNDRPTAKKFLAQFKTEMEENERLNQLWPNTFWADPKRNAPKWSLDDGLILQRSGNPREPTIGAYGLIDAQPTGSHFQLRIYDDTVTEDSVGSPEMILKTTERWELSQNLAITAVEGGDTPRQWHIGTRYHFGDTYGVLLKRGAFKARIYPATDDGTIDGKPILLSNEAWESKKKKESLFILACQQLLNPLAAGLQEFKLEWIRRYEVRPETLNVGILIDPADSKSKSACNTAMVVIGIDGAKNKYLLDGACHKMSLSERWVMLRNLHRKWVNSKGIQAVVVGYEKYGMQSDIQHMQHMMQHENYSFGISEVSWTHDSTVAKDDRIRRLEPDHRNWRFFYPYEGGRTRRQAEAEDLGKKHLVSRPIKRVDESGRIYNLVDYFINNEYLFFPASPAKDMMDAMSRFYDLELGPPRIYREADLIPATAGMV